MAPIVGAAASLQAPDIQLVPVTSGAESTSAVSSGFSQAESLPALEPLPLDAAILAHLDALSAAADRHDAESGARRPDAEDQAPAATPPEEAPALRRYRFDRPRPQANAASATAHGERLSGWRATPPTLMTAPATTAETDPAREELQSDAEEAHVEPIENAEAIAPASAAISPETGEAREEPEGKESPAIQDQPATEETASPEIEAAAEDQGEHESEHESEHEGTARRRRRRGRGHNGRTQDAETDEGEDDEPHGRAASPAKRQSTPYAAPESAISYARDYDTGNGFLPGVEGIDSYEESGYTPYTPAPRTRAPRPTAPAARQQNHQSPQNHQESPWNMANAQQHVQEPASPFGSPEPSFAHGFGPPSAGVASPLHESAPRIRRNERSGEAPPMSANQLGTVLTGAIAQQTDRLLSELRRQQYPPSMTVALPAFPSTERIGVFVDVANLLYSARSQRMSIDFGRLLDFLRGNRRLIRAHAYAPTNPDPHAEQTFLSAVKGVGYRITTKNYKTFASGARKADMDLDLCMDIVRLVDAGALDTVMLVSGDSDFLPLLEYCSDHGVRVEVAAFDDAAAMILRQSCDLFISLSQVDEIRA